MAGDGSDCPFAFAVDDGTAEGIDLAELARARDLFHGPDRRPGSVGDRTHVPGRRPQDRDDLVIGSLDVTSAG